MALHLFILLCLTGVVPLIQSVPRKYYLIQQSMAWSDAQAYCRTHHIDLAIVESDDDMTRLQDETQNQQFTFSNAWIGLYSELVDWYWTHGNEPLGSMTTWYPGEPDNYGGYNYWCGLLYPNYWYDGRCIDAYPFICFNETETGDQRYIYISTAMSWYEAQAYCRNHYTDLATVRDATENSVMFGLTPGWTWFGLTGESWKWINHTTFSTISWMSGRPYYNLAGQTCGYIYNGEAGDELCTYTMPFFCYRDITGQQKILRMEVRSNTDVNDPVVMDAIIKGIQQKLEERGLAKTVTVKWRIQPDRKVFHKKKAD